MLSFLRILFLFLFFCIEMTPLSAAEAPSPQKEPPLTLADAINMALTHNPHIDSMIKAVTQAEYLFSAASKELLPTFSTNYTYTYFPRPPHIKFTKEDLQDIEMSGEDVSVPLTSRNSYIWTSNMKMPLYTGWALEYQRDIARLGIRVAKIQLLEAKADLIQEVTLHYFHILRIQNCLHVVKENLKRFHLHECTTKKYYASGLIALNILLEIKTRKMQALHDLIAAKRDLTLARAALNITMGVDIDSFFHVCHPPLSLSAPASLTTSLLSAEKHNPTLLVLPHLEQRAKKVMGHEKAQTRPHISLDVGFTRYGKTPLVDGNNYMSNNILAGMVVADWKLFDWFKTRDKVKARQKDLEILINSGKITRQRILLDVRTAYLDMESAYYRFHTAHQEIAYARENYRINKLRYDEKLARATEVNDSLVLLKQAAFNYYTALYEYHTASARLARITGKNLVRYAVTEE